MRIRDIIFFIVLTSLIYFHLYRRIFHTKGYINPYIICRFFFEKVTLICKLFHKEYYDGANENEGGSTNAEISDLAIGTPLCVGLAKHFNAEQRATQIDCLIPHFEHLQYGENDNRNAYDYREYGDDFMS